MGAWTSPWDSLRSVAGSARRAKAMARSAKQDRTGSCTRPVAGALLGAGRTRPAWKSRRRIPRRRLSLRGSVSPAECGASDRPGRQAPRVAPISRLRHPRQHRGRAGITRRHSARAAQLTHASRQHPGNKVANCGPFDEAPDKGFPPRAPPRSKSLAVSGLVDTHGRRQYLTACFSFPPWRAGWSCAPGERRSPQPARVAYSPMVLS
jgi:hypothetical protein